MDNTEENKEPELESESEQATTTPQSSFSSPSYVSPSPRKAAVVVRWVVIVILVGLIIFGAVSLFRSQQGKSEESEITPTPMVEPSPTETPTPAVTTSPTPTKKATVTPTKAATSSPVPSKGLTLKVLNGSGITGKAAGARDFLQGLGYAVSSIGNADSEDYDKTVITILKSKEATLTTLKNDLSTKYTVGTTSATLSTSEGVDAVVIIGK